MKIKREVYERELERQREIGEYEGRSQGVRAANDCSLKFVLANETEVTLVDKDGAVYEVLTVGKTDVLAITTPTSERITKIRVEMSP